MYMRIDYIQNVYIALYVLGIVPTIRHHNALIKL